MKKNIIFILFISLLYINNVFANGAVIKDITLKYINSNLTINWVILENKDIKYSIDKYWNIKDKLIKWEDGYYLNNQKLNWEDVIFLDDWWFIFDYRNPKAWENYYIKYNGEKIFEWNKDEYLSFKKLNFIILNNWKQLSESVWEKIPTMYFYFKEWNWNLHKFALEFNNLYFLEIENSLHYDVICKNNNLVLFYNWKELIDLIWNKEIVFIRLNNLYWIRPNVYLNIDWKQYILDKEDDIQISWCTLYYNWLWKKYNIEVTNSVLNNNLTQIKKEEKESDAKIESNKIIYLKKHIIERNKIKNIFDENTVNWLVKKLEKIKDKVKKEDIQTQKEIINKLYNGLDVMAKKYNDNKWISLINYVRSYFEFNFFDL